MDIASILVAVSLTLAFYLFNKYFIAIDDHWKKHRVPCLKGTIPLLGDILPILSLRRSFDEFAAAIHATNRDRSMVGFYQFRRPSLVLRDPELIRKVLIDDFSSFHENAVSVDPSLDPLASRNPFFIDGDQWKKERARLSRSLMSAKQLKSLCHGVAIVCKKFAAYLDSNAAMSARVSYETESKEMFSRFTGEVVARLGFGVEGDFFSNGGGPNSFRETIEGSYDPTIANYIAMTLIYVAPKINKILRNRFVPRRMDQLFRRVVKNIISLRENETIARNDFLQAMLDNERKDNNVTDDSAITASVAAFFFDGYETSAIALSFFAHQIAANPRVQDELRDEVTTILGRHDGEISYESLGEMTLMDRALDESMRMHPALGFLVKRCTASCELVGHDGIAYRAEPGTDFIVSIRALHNDPDYWTNPEIYEPRRFDEANKRVRPKCVFMPFGGGPRMCVGMRFAAMQIKAAMATILRFYRIETSSRTELPVRLKRTGLLAAAEGGLWIKLRRLV